MQLIQQNYPVILNYIQKISKHSPEKFLYMFDVGILDYLHPEEKSQLIQQNYLIIFKNMQLILKPEIAEEIKYYYPKTLLDIFEERLFDYLSSEEKKELIQQNFLVLSIYIRRISRNLLNQHRISDETLSYIYLTVIKAIKGTPRLLDDFFNTLFKNSDSLYNWSKSRSVILKAIESIRNQELKQKKCVDATEKVSTISNDNSGEMLTAFMNAWRKSTHNHVLKQREYVSATEKVSKENNIYGFKEKVVCNKCGKILNPKAMNILVRKERVYCPNCGMLNRREFSPEARKAYVEAKLNELKHQEVRFRRFIGDERIRCPMCGAVGRDLKKIEYKSKLLYKIVCEKCGFEMKGIK